MTDDGSNNVSSHGVVPSHVVPAHVPAPVAKPIAPVAIAPSQPPAISQPPAPGPAQPAQTSWAAAAGKGLPTTTNDQTHTTSTASASNGSTSKHLEQLNSVREALFSQDGWGGSNVKQDSAWNVEGIPAPTNQGLNQPAPVPGGPGGNGSGDSGNLGGKESNTWGAAGSGHRNDGTDLWRVNLSGQPPATKPQPNNAWNHTPQNNTDFKQWGVDDGEDGANSGAGGGGAAGAPSAPGSNGAIGGNRPQGGGGSNMNPVGTSAGNDSMWGPDTSNNGPAPGSNQFQKRNNDWGSGPSGGGNAASSGGSWGDNPRGNGSGGDPMMNRNMNDPMGHRGGGGDTSNGAPGGGWGPAPQNKQPLNQGWGNNTGSKNNNSWDLESPSMQRREGGGRGGGGNGGIDDGGTSHWGFKPQQQGPAPGPPGTVQYFLLRDLFIFGNLVSV